MLVSKSVWCDGFDCTFLSWFCKIQLLSSYHEQGFLHPPRPATFQLPDFLIAGIHFVSSANQQVPYQNNTVCERNWTCQFACNFFTFLNWKRDLPPNVGTCMFWGDTFCLWSDRGSSRWWHYTPILLPLQHDLKETDEAFKLLAWFFHRYYFELCCLL